MSHQERLLRVWAWLAVAGMFGGIFLASRLHGWRRDWMGGLVVALEFAGLGLLVFLDCRRAWRRMLERTRRAK